jgi:hypothetical protein
MQTLLEQVKKADIFTDPFPHIVIKDPLDNEQCTQLIDQFPAIDVITEGKPFGSNDRFSYPTRDVLQNPKISPVWQEFIQAQSSARFWNQFVDLFQEEIRRLHPTFEQEFGALDQLQPGVRKIDQDTADVLLDAQICINAPVLEPAPVIKQAHVDRPQVVYAGLFYLRHPNDRSTGGNLEIYRFKKGRTHSFQGQYIDDKHVERVKTVHYERNVLVLFVNSVHSLHGVTARSVTDTPRCFVNLIAEVKRPIYDLGSYQEKNWLGQLKRSLARV